MELQGKIAFIAGVADDQGFGFAMAKKLAEKGCTILIGTWTPLYNIFVTSWKNGKFDESRRLPDGSLFEIEKVYSMDAVFDTMEDVPLEVKENKRYKDVTNYSISDVAHQIEKDFGKIDFFLHSLANAPEVTKPLLETSRKGYLAALSSSSYSFISLLKHLGPLLKDGSALSLTYIASERVIPGYGGGMSSAKAALESDTRTLAFEAGRKWNIRVNCISAGPLRSRAAKAIGMIDSMIAYSQVNAPLPRELHAEDVAEAAVFLLSPPARAITGNILYVDNGLHAMGMAIECKSALGS